MVMTGPFLGTFSVAHFVRLRFSCILNFISSRSEEEAGKAKEDKEEVERNAELNAEETRK